MYFEDSEGNHTWSIAEGEYVDGNGNIILEMRLDNGDGTYSSATAAAPGTFIFVSDYGYFTDNGYMSYIMPRDKEGDIITQWLEEVSKYGYIRADGIQITDISYDTAEPFSNGLAVVGVNEDDYGNIIESYFYGYINENGEEVIDLVYNDAWSFSDGLARVGKRVEDSSSMLYGYINNKCDEVIPMQFNNASNFSEGYAAVALYEEKDLKWGVIYLK